jgi:putative transposase
VKRAKIQDSDRIFWMLLRRSLEEWKDALIFVKPATVVKWHRRGFRYYWKRRSRSKPGRPPISMKVIMLIRRMSKENAIWGAPRISDELALLRYTVSDTTVAKYMVRHRETGPSQTWRTFIQNHLHETAACDFFTVPTATFKVLYCFVVLSLDRRRILHINVTSHPTAAWTARQLLEAFPMDTAPRFLMRDRDSIYGWEVARAIKALGITEV